MSQMDLTCFICSDSHDIPVSGYPVNRQIVKLIEKLLKLQKINQQISELEQNTLKLKNKMSNVKWNRHYKRVLFATLKSHTESN